MASICIVPILELTHTFSCITYIIAIDDKTFSNILYITEHRYIYVDNKTIYLKNVSAVFKMIQMGHDLGRSTW